MRDGNGQQLEPIPTPETKQPEATSVYALSKFVQERLCLVFGEAYQIPTIGLRFFNVYGPRQALSNPYTGVLAIFSSRLLSGQPPLIFEDGGQQRDFVNVHDVARACRLALEADSVSGGVFNIGSGQPLTVCDVATKIATILHREDIEPEILGRYRVGDIRHCFADISSARAQLGYEPLVTFEQGMIELAEWLMEQEAFEDGVVRAKDELLTRGLVL